jgi:hypothetical protein
MKTQSIPQADHRWFIWTIVFLLVSGVSLVSYIMITDINQDTALLDSVTVKRVQR